MARSSQTQTKRRSSSTNTSRNSGKRRLNSSAPEQGFLDDEAKRNILGISVIILAIILLVAAILPSKAVVTSFVSDVLHLTFGVGCYVFPVFLAAIGLSLMIQSEREHVSSRAALGLLLIFIAILTNLSLFSPNAVSVGPEAVFEKKSVISLGGYVGAGIAWVGLTLFGQVIATIIAAGVIVVSLIVIGFSLNDFKNKIDQKRKEHARKKEEEAALPSAALKAGAPNVAGYTRPLAPVDALQAPASGQKKAYRPATSLVGKGSLFEKNKREGWVDPTIAELEKEKALLLEIKEILPKDIESENQLDNEIKIIENKIVKVEKDLKDALDLLTNIQKSVAEKKEALLQNNRSLEKWTDIYNNKNNEFNLALSKNGFESY